jgi:hypothetical protein
MLLKEFGEIGAGVWKKDVVDEADGSGGAFDVEKDCKNAGGVEHDFYFETEGTM